MESQNKAVFSREAAWLLALAMLASAIYHFAHPFFLSPDYLHLPGVGLAVTQWVLLGGCLLCAARKKRLRITRGGMLLAVLSALLALCYALYANDMLRLMNLPVLLALTVQALFSLCGHVTCPALSAAGLWEGLCRFFPALGRYFSLPLRAMRQRAAVRDGRRSGLWLGIVVCVPVLAVIVWLLASADPVFRAFTDALFDRLGRFDLTLLRRLILFPLCGLVLFSLLYSSLSQGDAVPSPNLCAIRAPVFAVSLSALTAVYAVFCYIQVRYLFGGAEGALLQGGYAQYARSGFFQLVAAACITLALVAPPTVLYPAHRGMRALCGAVSLLTVVITASAFFRMRLYILAHGMTLLRLLTLWAMLMILLALICLLVKCIRPDLRLCPLLCTAALCSWVALNLSCMPLQVARYNVRAYQAGRLSTLDSDHLFSLSPDAWPALEALGGSLDADTIRRKWEDLSPVWYDWALSWESVPRR